MFRGVLMEWEEAAAALRMSRSVLYEPIRSGPPRTVKQGRHRLVPVSALLSTWPVWSPVSHEYPVVLVAMVTVGYGGRGKRLVRHGYGRTKTEAKGKAARPAPQR